MAVRTKDNFRRYIQQQIDLGLDELHLPVATRGINPKPNGSHISTMPKPKKLPIDKFTEAKSLDELEVTIEGCKKCRLGETRTKFVFGTGNPQSDIMFVGEAPGHDEDIQGKPFVGRAGKLLDKMLVEAGFNRDDVYITNTSASVLLSSANR